MPPKNTDDPLRTTDHTPNPAPAGPEVTADFPQGSTPADGGATAYVPGVATQPMGTESGLPSGAVAVPGYEIEGVLGRGGMGVVYKRRQLALKRTVALKMVLAGGHAGPRERARFRIEAEAVARLQHPNIVQIHEVGEADGYPYCALEFVAGGNLADQIEGTPMPARKAAKLLELLARAMHLAHSRNVVHRDLKPANILLAADGTPKISDFGLARQTDSNSAETRAGAVMGTPSYMAPEQASGHAHEAGPAADIYALGAILYDCLAGRPPFQGTTVVETLDQVRTQEPLPPSRWRADVPPDLDTICLKCLRKDPEKRYASAAELADELVRYQQGEPILARPVGRIDRAVRWVRRNPVVAAAAVAVVLTLAAGTTVSYLKYLDAEEQKEIAQKQKGIAEELKEIAQKQKDATQKQKETAEEQKEIAQKQQRLANANFALAYKAVEDSISSIAEDPQLREADFHELRRKLLASAVPFYEEFARQKSDDPGLEAERGRAYGRLAYVREEMGDNDRALADLEQMARIFGRLATAHPEVPSYREELLNSYDTRGVLLEKNGKLADAEAAFREVLKLSQQLAADFPDVSQYRENLVVRYNNLGTLLRSVRKDTEAESALRAAIKSNQQLPAESAARPKCRVNLAHCHHNLGALLDDLGRPSEAEQSIRAALGLRSRLVADFPEVGSYRNDLGASYNSLAIVLTHRHRPQEAREAYRAALEIRGKLAAQFPKVLEYRRRLAGTYNSLGVLLYGTGQFAEAESVYRDALRMQEKLAVDFPGMPEFRVGVAGTCCNLGHVLRDKNQFQAALPWYDRAIKILGEVLAQSREMAVARIYLQRTYEGRANTLSHLQRHADAAKDWDHVIEIADGQVHPALRLTRALAWVRTGTAAKVLPEVESLLEAPQNAPNMLYDAACFYALAAKARDQVQAAERHAVKAVALLRQAQAAGFFDEPARSAHVKSDPDLDSLRARTDFKQWRAGLDKDN